jgi:hypothetical protein
MSYRDLIIYDVDVDVVHVHFLGGMFMTYTRVSLKFATALKHTKQASTQLYAYVKRNRIILRLFLFNSL